MRSSFHRFSRSLAFLLLLPAAALAHPGHDGYAFTWDFGGGFLHPLTGWDHLLAMLAVGLWAAQLGARARWLVPSAFLAALAVGAALAQRGIALPAVEPFIAASLLVLGLLLALSVRLPLSLGAALVGLFALFHGYAHGAEMPVPSAALSYGLGFLAATALLHLAGLALGVGLSRHPKIVRTAGVAVALAGAAAFAL